MRAAAVRATSGPTTITSTEPEPLLASRFVVPALPAAVVPRQRLVEKIHMGADGPLTLVSAPAGTGKTVAVAAWVHEGDTPGPVVWVRLDDVRPAGPTLWSLIVEGLRRSELGVDGPLPVSAGPAPGRAFLSAVATKIAVADRPVVLVLDRVDDMLRGDALALDYLVRRSAGRLRLILLSRSDPLLPLHRYRLEAALTEVRMADLAFTSDEGHALLAGRGVALSPAGTDLVMRRTEGWAAGLVLTAMSLAHREQADRAAAELSGDTGTVAEYLLSEVLDAQTDTARELLLRTSIVDVLRPGLVEALAGPHAYRALTFLVHGNAFLDAVPETPGWFRFHPLFRELLRAQLAYESPGASGQLHAAAAEWLAEHGRLEEAVRHAAAAEAWEDGARYVVDALAVGRLLLGPRETPMAEVLGKAPREATGPALALVRAARALSDHDSESCARYLALARQLLKEGQPWPTAELTQEVLTARHALATGDLETARQAASHAERALRQTTDEHPGRGELDTVVRLAQASISLWAGDVEAAADGFAAAASSSRAAGSAQLLARSLSSLALVAAWRRHLRKARRLADESLAAQSERGRTSAEALVAAEVALAWVCTESYDLPAARRHVERAAEVARTGEAAEDPMARVMLALVESRAKRARGDLAGATALVAAAQNHEPAAPGWLTDELRLEEGLLLIATGEPARAAAVAEELMATGPDQVGVDAAVLLAHARLATGDAAGEPVPMTTAASAPLGARVDGWLLEASRRLRSGQDARAGQALERSLRLAAPEELRRPFREAPADVRRLLRVRDDLAGKHFWLGVDAAPDDVRRRAVATAPGPVGAPVELRPAPVEELTEKELEVLGHLAELLSTEEIAAAMFVSVNTVRTHVRNILRKLSASRRNEAVRRARQLRILAS